MLSMIEKRLVPAKILIKDAPDTDFSGYPTNSNSRIQDNGTRNQQFAKPKVNYFLRNRQLLTTAHNWVFQQKKVSGLCWKRPSSMFSLIFGLFENRIFGRISGLSYPVSKWTNTGFLTFFQPLIEWILRIIIWKIIPWISRIRHLKNEVGSGIQIYDFYASLSGTIPRIRNFV